MCKRKTIGLLVVLFCSTSALLAQMSGSYTVGSGGHYATISDAIADIKSQGLSGDVTLTISAGTYDERIDLSNLNNGTFAVILEGEDMENTVISPPYEDVTTFTGINIEDTDNITIRNLTIVMPVESGGTQIGIYSQDASNLSLEGNMISSKTGIAMVGGINIGVSSNIVVAEGVALGIENINTVDVIHNTLHSDQTGFRNNKASGDFNIFTQAVLVFDGIVSNVNVINNIFSGVASEYADGNAAISFGVDGSFLGTSTTTNLTSDYNLFDADLSMAVVGLEGISSLENEALVGDFSLADWKIIEYDLNSISYSPDFIDNTDFRARNEDFRFGTYLPEFATDIDGETRVEGSVDVGADQFCVSIEVSESISSCESYAFAGSTLTESGEYFGEFVAVNGCDSLVTLNLTILEPAAGSDEITAKGSYGWNGIIYSETGTYEQVLTGQNGCDSVATLNLTIEPYLLEGTFIIGSSEEADFESFEKAIADLQFATLTGDVGYTVEAGTYNETLKISEINSSDHSISFIGEDKNTTILHPMESIDATGAGVLIEGTNKVTLQNLTLEMDDITDVQVSLSSNDTKGISVVDANNITLDNLSIRNDSEVSEYNSSQFFISSGLSIANVDELTITNSSFSGAGYHITLGEHSNMDVLGNTFQSAYRAIRDTETGTNLSIEDNNFNGPFETGIDLDEIEDVSVLSNVLDGVDQTASLRGIYIDFANGSIVRGNTVKNVETGIYLRESNTGEVSQNKVFFTSDRSLYLRDMEDLTVTNNFLGDLVYVRESIALDFVHNTVVVSSDRDQAVLVDYPNSLSGFNHSFVNNIIVGGNEIETLVEISNLSDPSVLTLDHNLYYLAPNIEPTVTTALMNFNTTEYSDLAAWQSGQSGTTFDQNSQSFAPVFADTDDFHITSGTNYRFGIFLADFATDIDGETRLEGSVDVGADQFCVSIEVIESLEACESYEFDGLMLTESGQYFGKFVAVNGCDSLVTLNLTILEPDNVTVTESVCDSFEFDGAVITASGAYSAAFMNEAGCDSLVTLNLTILASTSSEENAVACGSYEWNNNVFTTSGTYEEIFTNAAGCDSTATLNLIISESAACAPLSTGEISDIVISPNPTRGWINVQGVESNSAYYVSDLSGRVVQQGTIIDSKLLIEAEAGAYLLSIPYLNKVIRIIKVE